MRALKWATGRTQYVIEAGRAACPVWGDVDVEQCFACPNVRDVVLENDATGIVTCSPPSGLDQFIDYVWPA